MPIFDTHELDLLIVAFRARSVKAAEELSVAVRKAAYDIEATAKQFVPVDTGATRNSIHASFPSLLEAEVGPTTFYAPYLEFGTSRMAPRPFLGPAADKHTPSFVAATVEIGGRL